MKPTTPQEYAQDYGVFIADMLIVAKTYPDILKWVSTYLPNVSLVYKTNLSIFSGYVASITSFPSEPTNFRGNKYNKEVDAYNKEVTLLWTTITIDLKSSLLAADVDPSTADFILSRFRELKPRAHMTK